MAVRKWLTRALTVAAVAASGVVGVSSAAHAYLNTCYPVHGGNWGGGRCTGSGTDWSYRPAINAVPEHAPSKDSRTILSNGS